MDDSGFLLIKDPKASTTPKTSAAKKVPASKKTSSKPTASTQESKIKAQKK